MERARAGPQRPVAMRLFAAWEGDRSPANCDPRLCTLTITRLTLTAPLPGLSSVTLAARMHSSKRTLRSNEISFPANGSLLDTELDLNFSLQYPHFVKRDGNRLQIMLQRRKKYKNRTILGYKTLAKGIIRMDQVLQKSMDMELELCADTESGKAEKIDRANGQGLPALIARLVIHQLTSMPVDHDSKNNNTLLLADRGYSDEEEEAEFSSVEDNDEGMLTSYTSNNQRRAMVYNKRNLSYNKLDRDMNYSNMDRDSYMGNKGTERDSDSEFENRHSKRKGGSRGKITQRNLKQKFVALLRRFKVPDELEPGETRRSGALEGDREIDELFKELESLSCGEDSGPELDTISISSTPKPSLRPFFASSRSLIHQEKEGGPLNQIPTVTPAVKQQPQDKLPPPEKALQNPNDLTAKEKKYSANSGTLAEGDQWWNRGPCGPDGSLLPFLDQDDLCDAQASRDQLNLNDQLMSGSPPKEKDEKKSRLFRSNVSGPSGGGRKKQSLTISTDQQLKPAPSEHSAQSPTNAEPRRGFLEQVNKILGGDDTGIPEVLSLAHPARDGASAALLATRLTPLLPQPALNPHNSHEVRVLMQSLLNKICKVCNTSSKPMQPVRIVLVGSDALIGSALRAYVDLWAQRPPDWGAHVRFYLVPLGVNYISRYLASIDSGYAILFGNEGWHSLCERAADGSTSDANDLTGRINRYISGSGPTIQLPIAEAMVAYREKSCEEDSSQIFVPFINDVRIGATESAQHSVDLEEALGPPGGSPPAAGLRPSPPATPAPPSVSSDSTPLTPLAPSSQHWEPLELQLDYWQLSKQGDSQVKVEDLSTRKKIEGHLKSAAGVTSVVIGNSTPGPGSGFPGATRGSVKSIFRSLQVSRLCSGIDPQTSLSFFVTYATKEKKQKIMRLGKKKEKDKDSEAGRTQVLEGISRLVCSAKSSHSPFRVYIDGTEWSGVKFFQLSTQWHTHIKSFPIALLGAPLAPQEML